jgi:3,4-dihydroxy 2-butanone 4-phosphate synthase/GTP cyclohydrolase II
VSRDTARSYNLPISLIHPLRRTNRPAQWLRPRKTEAAVDLTKLPPVGVISELMNDDGSVMKGSQVIEFAARHRLKHITIADIVRFRQGRERLIERVSP